MWRVEEKINKRSKDRQGEWKKESEERRIYDVGPATEGPEGASLGPLVIRVSTLAGPPVVVRRAGLLLFKPATVEPSLTARIEGVEMDFWRVRMRGESHLFGSPPMPPPLLPLSLLAARGFTGIAAVNCNWKRSMQWWKNNNSVHSD